jgi:thiol-disulfide isomerase/thioredoxin
MSSRTVVLATLACCFALAGARAEEKLLGTRPPEWEVGDWINSKPLTLKDLAGKVILVRWWTSGCPFCKATAPALDEFHARYHDEGLVVIGFYHHKSDTPLKVEQVKESAAKLGFEFPVAIDRDWRTLKRWWLDDNPRSWTSVSFLIDRKGMIRHIHPGGQYVRGDRAYETLKAKIEELLKEK